MGGGCQGWLSRAAVAVVVVAVVAAACTGQQQPIVVAGDAWVAGEKAWVMHPCHRASSSWLAMGPRPL